MCNDGNDVTDNDDDTASPTGNGFITFVTLLADTTFHTVKFTPDIAVVGAT